jgi:hypothetical protein
MLFAAFDHHIPRSASSIESSGASEEEAISITKHPARELALMNAIGPAPALMDSRVSSRSQLAWSLLDTPAAHRDTPTAHRFAALGCPDWPSAHRCAHCKGSRCERVTDVKLERT